ncbi:hypothetical protein T08_1807 [Trichinella sp. T8]|nr:hypothetical protein T08_1807 [Trichinella sp. T8]
MMRRKTLPRTAAAKSADERAAIYITDTDIGGKKRARCQFCVSSDNKTSVRCENVKNTFVKIIHNHIVIYVQKKFNRRIGPEDSGR